MEKGEGGGIDKFSILASEQVKATMAMTETVIDSSKIMTENVRGLSGNVIESTKSISGSVLDSTKVVTGSVLDKTKVVTGNVLDGAGGVMSKFRDDFGLRSKRGVKSTGDEKTLEEIDFAIPPQPKSDMKNDEDLFQDDDMFVDKQFTSAKRDGETKDNSIEQKDLTEIYDFLDEKPDAAEAAGFFTIDDEDFDI